MRNSKLEDSYGFTNSTGNESKARIKITKNKKHLQHFSGENVLEYENKSSNNYRFMGDDVISSMASKYISNGIQDNEFSLEENHLQSLESRLAPISSSCLKQNHTKKTPIKTIESRLMPLSSEPLWLKKNLSSPSKNFLENLYLDHLELKNNIFSPSRDLLEPFSSDPLWLKNNLLPPSKDLLEPTPSMQLLDHVYQALTDPKNSVVSLSKKYSGVKPEFKTSKTVRMRETEPKVEFRSQFHSDPSLVKNHEMDDVELEQQEEIYTKPKNSIMKVSSKIDQKKMSESMKNKQDVQAIKDMFKQLLRNRQEGMQTGCQMCYYCPSRRENLTGANQCCCCCCCPMQEGYTPNLSPTNTEQTHKPLSNFDFDEKNFIGGFSNFGNQKSSMQQQEQQHQPNTADNQECCCCCCCPIPNKQTVSKEFIQQNQLINNKNQSKSVPNDYEQKEDEKIAGIFENEQSNSDKKNKKNFEKRQSKNAKNDDVEQTKKNRIKNKTKTKSEGDSDDEDLSEKSDGDFASEDEQNKKPNKGKSSKKTKNENEVSSENSSTCHICHCFDKNIDEETKIKLGNNKNCCCCCYCCRRPSKKKRKKSSSEETDAYQEELIILKQQHELLQQQLQQILEQYQQQQTTNNQQYQQQNATNGIYDQQAIQAQNSENCCLYCCCKPIRGDQNVQNQMNFCCNPTGNNIQTNGIPIDRGQNKCEHITARENEDYDKLIDLLETMIEKHKKNKQLKQECFAGISNQKDNSYVKNIEELRKSNSEENSYLENNEELPRNNQKENSSVKNSEHLKKSNFIKSIKITKIRGNREVDTESLSRSKHESVNNLKNKISSKVLKTEPSNNVYKKRMTTSKSQHLNAVDGGNRTKVRKSNNPEPLNDVSSDFLPGEIDENVSNRKSRTKKAIKYNRFLKGDKSKKLTKFSSSEDTLTQYNDILEFVDILKKNSKSINQDKRSIKSNTVKMNENKPKYFNDDKNFEFGKTEKNIRKKTGTKRSSQVQKHSGKNKYKKKYTKGRKSSGSKKYVIKIDRSNDVEKENNESTEEMIIDMENIMQNIKTKKWQDTGAYEIFKRLDDLKKERFSKNKNEPSYKMCNENKYNEFKSSSNYVKINDSNDKIMKDMEDIIKKIKMKKPENFESHAINGRIENPRTGQFIRNGPSYYYDTETVENMDEQREIFDKMKKEEEIYKSMKQINDQHEKLKFERELYDQRKEKEKLEKVKLEREFFEFMNRGKKKSTMGNNKKYSPEKLSKVKNNKHSFDSDASNLEMNRKKDKTKKQAEKEKLKENLDKNMLMIENLTFKKIGVFEGYKFLT